MYFSTFAKLGKRPHSILADHNYSFPPCTSLKLQAATVNKNMQHFPITQLSAIRSDIPFCDLNIGSN